MTAALYVLHHSPWSERARWALEHHGIAFEEREHVPLIGELALRARAKKWSGKVSVPLFVDPGAGVVVQGSTAIAEHADAIGSGSRLFPPDSRATMNALEDAVEDLLNAARARFVLQLGSDREARLESVPPWMRPIPFVAVPSAKLGAWFIARKYRASFEGIDARIRAGLQAVRDALGSRAHVLGAFSYADILAASAVQAIAPPAERFLDLPPATRRLWAHPELARELADLIAWRDALYDRSRRRGK